MSLSEAPNAASTILWWLRRPGHERQLTDCLGELARVDAAIAHGLAAGILEAAEAQRQGVAAPARARTLRAALPQELSCSREEATGKLMVRDRSWWRKEQTRSGRLDWVFHPPGQEHTGRNFQLAVEVKIGAGLSRHQLTDYRHHLTRRRGSSKGLVVLARSFPDRGLLADGDEHWLGVVLWNQVLPRLRAVQPSDDALAVQWPLLLGVLETRDDLGTEPVTWASVSAADPGQAMRQLGEHVRHRSESPMRDALARRAPAGSGAAQLAALELRTPRGRRTVKLGVRIKAQDKTHAAEVVLRATAEGILLTATVYPLPRRRGPLARQAKQSHDEALRRLTSRRLKPSYTQATRGYARERLIPVAEADVRSVVAGAVDEELRHIVRSGVLDEDLRYAG